MWARLYSFQLQFMLLCSVCDGADRRRIYLFAQEEVAGCGREKRAGARLAGAIEENPS